MINREQAYTSQLLYWSNLTSLRGMEESPQVRELKRMAEFWQDRRNWKNYTCKLFEIIENGYDKQI